MTEECMVGLGIRPFCDVAWDGIFENFSAMYERMYREEDERANGFRFRKLNEMEQPCP